MSAFAVGEARGAGNSFAVNDGVAVSPFRFQGFADRQTVLQIYRAAVSTHSCGKRAISWAMASAAWR